jgi:pyruvate dehydrogenase kinase 2/3/4
LQVASFLRRELPIRLAHRVQDLEGVPLVKDMPSVKQVKDLYIKSLLELSEFDKNIETPEQEERFSRLVESIYERHSGVLVQMARGAYEFRNHVTKDQRNERDTFAKMEETHAFLDRFYLCRKFWSCPKAKYVLLVQFN